MTNYAQYLTPISSGGFSCNGCGAPLEKGSLFCDCADNLYKICHSGGDCGAIYCEECVKNSTFETHICENE
jgi:hypothetical protein